MKKFEKILIELKSARLNNEADKYDELLKDAIVLITSNNIPRCKVWEIFNQEVGNLRYMNTPFAMEIKNKIKQSHEGVKVNIHPFLIEYPYGIMLDSGYYFLNNGFN